MDKNMYKEILVDKEKNDITTPIAKKYKGILGKKEITVEYLRKRYQVTFIEDIINERAEDFGL